MARLYEWEEFLTKEEHRQYQEDGDMLATYKDIAKELSASRDAIRRKAVQRARNALNKQARAAMVSRS